MNQDREHLRLLSIFHYVVAGLAALCACFPLIHLTIGLFMVFAPEELGTHGGPPPAVFGWVFIGVAGCCILAGVTLALLIAVTGHFLTQRRRYLFCMVVAAMECIFMPFGTALGVLTLIVLMRYSVKGLFAAQAAVSR